MTIASKSTLGLRSKSQITLSIPTSAYRSLPIPSVEGAKMGDCFVRVTDLPKQLQDFMEVNPRIPNRAKRNNALTGHVVKSIRETLTDNPSDMAIKNQGIYILVDEVRTFKEPGNQEFLEIKLSDKRIHGILNGGHTFHAILDTIEKASPEDANKISSAWVRLHILSGIGIKQVPEMAEGLNRSKQVDDASLYNLSGSFESIKDRMKSEIGAEAISYCMGDDGEFYITNVLNIMQMFNRDRYDEDNHPTALYNSKVSGLRFFELDDRPYNADEPKKSGNRKAINVLIRELPELLKLYDKVTQKIPDFARDQGYEIGRMKVGGNRAGSAQNKNIKLHFINETMDYRIPNGWVYPILAAFRANVKWHPENEIFEWKVPIDDLLEKVMPKLVSKIITAKSKDEKSPDKIGKDSSIYDQFYMTVENAIDKM